MNELEVYSPDRMAAIRAALDASPDRRGALREILILLHEAGNGDRERDPAQVMNDIVRVLFRAQNKVDDTKPPKAASNPFLSFLARILVVPIDAPDARADAAARLCAIADAALAVYRLKGKEWE